MEWRKQPANWYEVGQLLFPNENEEFYSLFAVYWELKGNCENLEKLTHQQFTQPFPYAGVAHYAPWKRRAA